MGFMEKQIEFGAWILVDGDCGLEAIPADLVGDLSPESFCSEPENIERNGDNWRATFSPAADVPHELSDYVETRRAMSIERRNGWGARLSAPGYLDCTSWGVFDSEQEARESLDDDDEPADDDEPENLDCFVNPTELDTIADDESKPEQIREYAGCKARAMRCRLAGRIQAALIWENTCERLYKLLPDNLRW